MIARSNTQASPEVVDNCPNGCWDLQASIESGKAAQNGNDQDEGRINPIDMLIPVT